MRLARARRLVGQIPQTVRALSGVVLALLSSLMGRATFLYVRARARPYLTAELIAQHIERFRSVRARVRPYGAMYGTAYGTTHWMGRARFRHVRARAHPYGRWRNQRGNPRRILWPCRNLWRNHVWRNPRRNLGVQHTT